MPPKAIFMKRILFILIFINTSFLCAQESKFGVTVGVNYPWQSKNGELVAAPNLSLFPNPVIGGQAGVFYERDFNKFLIRPQVLFYRSRGKYDFPNTNPIYTLDKVNLELLFGYEIIDKFSILAGPAYQFIIRNDFDTTGEDVRDNMNAINIPFGIKYEISDRLEASLMYNYTLESDEYQRPLLPYDGGFQSFILDDAKIDVISLNISFSVFTSKNSRNRRAKSGSRGCYF